MKLMNACKIFIKIGKRISFALYSPYMVLVKKNVFSRTYYTKKRGTCLLGTKWVQMQSLHKNVIKTKSKNNKQDAMRNILVECKIHMFCYYLVLWSLSVIPPISALPACKSPIIPEYKEVVEFLYPHVSLNIFNDVAFANSTKWWTNIQLSFVIASTCVCLKVKIISHHLYYQHFLFLICFISQLHFIKIINVMDREKIVYLILQVCKVSVVGQLSFPNFFEQTPNLVTECPSLQDLRLNFF